MSHARLPGRSRALLVTLAALATAVGLTIAVAPSAFAQSQQPGFGGVVGDVDQAEHVFASGGPDEIRFRDGDSNGNLNQDEAVYLSSGSSVESGDVRLANPRTSDAFSKVGSGDSDADLSTESLDGTLRYFDEDRSGAFSPGDVLYYDLSGSGEDQVSTRDVVLAGDGAGTVIESGNERLGFGLADLSATPSYGYYDENDDGTQDGDEVSVIDVDNDGYVTVGDVRLGDTDGGAGGTIAALGEADVTYYLETFDGTWDFDHRDPDGDGSFDQTEAAYLSTGSSVATFAVRVANPPSEHESGTQVVETDSDWSINTESISGGLAHDGDGTFGSGDTLYYDVDSTGDVARGDIILVGANAGSVVEGGSGDTGNSLDNYGGTLYYMDANGNDVYDGGDLVYADTDSDQIVETGDIQLSRGAELPAPPSITLDTPVDGANVTVGENVSIEGTASAGDADLSTVEVDVDGESLDVTGIESFNATWTAEGVGEHTVDATVTDADDNTNTTSVSITVEAEPADSPTVALEAPTANDTLVAGQAVEVNGTATAGDANLSSVEVTAAGSSLEVTGLESFNATWTPEDPGTYLVQATVTDEDGLTGTASVEATVEQPDPPTIEITEPAEMAQATVGELVNVTGTASEGSAALDTVTVTANGSSLDVAGTGSWQATWVPEGAGVQTINATVTDEVGLAASDEVRVNVTAADEDEGAETVPGAGPLIVVAAVAGLALAARRTRA